MNQDTRNKVIQLTQAGLDALVKELDQLVNTKRPKVVERLSRARQEGDLSENSDYISAKEELEFLDGRIEQLQNVVDHAQVVKSNSNGVVAVGTVVHVAVNGSKHEFSIVGEWEADPTARKISYSSPLGQALVGKKKGDEVQVEAPAGQITYKIIDVNAAK